MLKNKGHTNLTKLASAPLPSRPPLLLAAF